MRPGSVQTVWTGWTWRTSLLFAFVAAGQEAGQSRLWCFAAACPRAGAARCEAWPPGGYQAGYSVCGKFSRVELKPVDGAGLDQVLHFAVVDYAGHQGVCNVAGHPGEETRVAEGPVGVAQVCGEGRFGGHVMRIALIVNSLKDHVSPVEALALSQLHFVGQTGLSRHPDEVVANEKAHEVELEGFQNGFKTIVEQTASSVALQDTEGVLSALVEGLLVLVEGLLTFVEGLLTFVEGLLTFVEVEGLLVLVEGLLTFVEGLLVLVDGLLTFVDGLLIR